MRTRYISLHKETRKRREDFLPNTTERRIVPGIFTKPLNQNFVVIFCFFRAFQLLFLLDSYFITKILELFTRSL